MKKSLKLLILVIFATMTFTFVACGGSDNEPDNPDDNTSGPISKFVGTWAVSSPEENDGYQPSAYFRFNSDNTFIQVHDYFDGDIKVSYGTWSNTDDSFTIDWEVFQGSIPHEKLSLTYEIVSTASNLFVLFLNDKTYNYTKVPNSVLDKYEDEINKVMGDIPG